jgi:hypothetical protein
MSKIYCTRSCRKSEGIVDYQHGRFLAIQARLILFSSIET